MLPRANLWICGSCQGWRPVHRCRRRVLFRRRLRMSPSDFSDKTCGEAATNHFHGDVARYKGSDHGHGSIWEDTSSDTDIGDDIPDSDISDFEDDIFSIQSQSTLSSEVEPHSTAEQETGLALIRAHEENVLRMGREHNRLRLQAVQAERRRLDEIDRRMQSTAHQGYAIPNQPWGGIPHQGHHIPNQPFGSMPHQGFTTPNPSPGYMPHQGYPSTNPSMRVMPQDMPYFSKRNASINWEHARRNVPNMNIPEDVFIRRERGAYFGRKKRNPHLRTYFSAQGEGLFQVENAIQAHAWLQSEHDLEMGQPEFVQEELKRFQAARHGRGGHVSILGTMPTKEKEDNPADDFCAMTPNYNVAIAWDDGAYQTHHINSLEDPAGVDNPKDAEQTTAWPSDLFTPQSFPAYSAQKDPFHPDFEKPIPRTRAGRAGIVSAGLPGASGISSSDTTIYTPSTGESIAENTQSGDTQTSPEASVSEIPNVCESGTRSRKEFSELKASASGTSLASFLPADDATKEVEYKERAQHFRVLGENGKKPMRYEKDVLHGDNSADKFPRGDPPPGFQHITFEGTLYVVQKPEPIVEPTPPPLFRPTRKTRSATAPSVIPSEDAPPADFALSGPATQKSTEAADPDPSTRCASDPHPTKASPRYFSYASVPPTRRVSRFFPPSPESPVPSDDKSRTPPPVSQPSSASQPPLGKSMHEACEARVPSSNSASSNSCSMKPIRITPGMLSREASNPQTPDSAAKASDPEPRSKRFSDNSDISGATLGSSWVDLGHALEAMSGAAVSEGGSPPLRQPKAGERVMSNQRRKDKDAYQPGDKRDEHHSPVSQQQQAGPSKGKTTPESNGIPPNGPKLNIPKKRQPQQQRPHQQSNPPQHNIRVKIPSTRGDTLPSTLPSSPPPAKDRHNNNNNNKKILPQLGKWKGGNRHRATYNLWTGRNGPWDKAVGE